MQTLKQLKRDLDSNEEVRSSLKAKINEEDGVLGELTKCLDEYASGNQRRGELLQKMRSSSKEKNTGEGKRHAFPFKKQIYFVETDVKLLVQWTQPS